MKRTGLLYRFIRRLGACTSRGCARPCVMIGAGVRRLARFRDTDACRKVIRRLAFAHNRLRHAPDIRLTPRSKTLQSP